MSCARSLPFFELNGDICSGLKLPRSSQHAVGNLQGFLVGFYLTSDIQHCRDRATNLIVLHGASMLRIAYNGYLWPIFPTTAGRLIEPHSILALTCTGKRRFATTFRSLRIALELLHTSVNHSGSTYYVFVDSVLWSIGPYWLQAISSDQSSRSLLACSDAAIMASIIVRRAKMCAHTKVGPMMLPRPGRATSTTTSSRATPSMFSVTVFPMSSEVYCFTSVICVDYTMGDSVNRSGLRPEFGSDNLLSTKRGESLPRGGCPVLWDFNYVHPAYCIF